MRALIPKRPGDETHVDATEALQVLGLGDRGLGVVKVALLLAANEVEELVFEGEGGAHQRDDLFHFRV